jgi:hypothetical protein
MESDHYAEGRKVAWRNFIRDAAEGIIRETGFEHEKNGTFFLTVTLNPSLMRSSDVNDIIRHIVLTVCVRRLDSARRLLGRSPGGGHGGLHRRMLASLRSPVERNARINPIWVTLGWVDFLPFVHYPNGGRLLVASPGALVDVVADVLGIAAPTVTQYDRALAENGLRSKSGRGTSAAKVSARDAANLLIAILGSPVSGASIKDAAEICVLYGALPSRESAAWRKNFSRLGFPSLSKLPRQHSFLDGLSALIEGATKGEAVKIPGLRKRSSREDWFLGVTLAGPDPWAQILADGSLGKANPTPMARFVYSTHVPSHRAGERSDLHQERHITFKTIRRLGELLSGERR